MKLQKLAFACVLAVLACSEAARVKTKQMFADDVNGESGRRRKKVRTAVKQCIKNDSGTSIKLKAFTTVGKKKHQDDHFLFGEEYCHRSDNADNMLTFIVKTNSCDIARGFAKAGAVTAVVGVMTAAAVLTGGASLPAQIAGSAMSGIIGMTTAGVTAAITSLPSGQLDGLVLIPNNMKEGGKQMRIVGNCVDDIEIRGR